MCFCVQNVLFFFTDSEFNFVTKDLVRIYDGYEQKTKFRRILLAFVCHYNIVKRGTNFYYNA